MKRFTGKTVLVTGGNSGIGLATAAAFVEEGARIVVTGRDATALQNAKKQLGDGAIALQNDASDPAEAKNLAKALQDAGVRLDAIFFNAGIAKLVPFTAVTPELWDSTFDINVKGVYFQIQALAPLLNRGASLVINGSINAHIGMPNSSVYAASKAAVISLAKTLSAELLPQGARVNVVSPGPIDTPLYSKLGLPQDQLASAAAQIQSQVPLGRFGTSRELASTVLHLAAPESAFIVGTEIIVDGGMSQL